MNLRISPLTTEYQYPQLSLLIITLRSKTNKTCLKVMFYYPMLKYSVAGCACFKHSNLFKVNDSMPKLPARLSNRGVQFEKAEPTSSSADRLRVAHSIAPELKSSTASQNPTTSFLTATTLIYAIGAGITAGAGTRLVLQSFLVKVFKLYSFHIMNAKSAINDISCHYLPVLGFGNLRACCLPWK